MTTLGSIAQFVRGVTFKPTDVLDEATDDSVDIMRTKNVQATLDRSDVISIPRVLVKRTDQFLRAGDTLISSANSWNLVGKCCWVPNLDRPTAIGGFVTALRPDRQQVEAKYLYHWFSSPRVQATVRSFGNQTTSISNLNLKRCEELDVPLPPLEEQRRITTILDQADVLRAKRRQALAHLDDLNRSIFLDMFGDPAINPRGFALHSLGSLAAVFRDGPFGSNLKSSHYVANGVRVIRLQNIGIGRFVDKDRAYVTHEHFASLDKHRCLPGDVLIATLGDPNLRACLQPEDVGVALNKADCVQMRVDPTQAEPEWVCALINIPGTLRLATSLVLGQTRSRISMGRLRELEVPVPPLELQREFCAQVGAINAQRVAMNAVLDAQDQLFASMESRAFRGEL